MITCENIKVWWLFQTWPSSLPVEEDQVGGDLLLLGRCGAWRGPGEFTPNPWSVVGKPIHGFMHWWIEIFFVGWFSNSTWIVLGCFKHLIIIDHYWSLYFETLIFQSIHDGFNPGSPELNQQRDTFWLPGKSPHLYSSMFFCQLNSITTLHN